MQITLPGPPLVKRGGGLTDLGIDFGQLENLVAEFEREGEALGRMLSDAVEKRDRWESYAVEAKRELERLHEQARDAIEDFHADADAFWDDGDLLLESLHDAEAIARSFGFSQEADLLGVLLARARAALSQAGAEFYPDDGSSLPIQEAFL